MSNSFFCEYCNREYSRAYYSQHNKTFKHARNIEIHREYNIDPLKLDMESDYNKRLIYTNLKAIEYEEDYSEYKCEVDKNIKNIKKNKIKIDDFKTHVEIFDRLEECTYDNMIALYNTIRKLKVKYLLLADLIYLSDNLEKFFCFDFKNYVYDIKIRKNELIKIYQRCYKMKRWMIFNTPHDIRTHLTNTFYDKILFLNKNKFYKKCPPINNKFDYRVIYNKKNPNYNIKMTNHYKLELEQMRICINNYVEEGDYAIDKQILAFGLLGYINLQKLFCDDLFYIIDVMNKYITYDFTNEKHQLRPRFNNKIILSFYKLCSRVMTDLGIVLGCQIQNKFVEWPFRFKKIKFWSQWELDSGKHLIIPSYIPKYIVRQNRIEEWMENRRKEKKTERLLHRADIRAGIKPPDEKRKRKPRLEPRIYPEELGRYYAKPRTRRLRCK
jgi:hypothetical protein